MTLRSILLVLAASALFARAPLAQSTVAGWGNSWFNSDWNQEAFVQVSAGGGEHPGPSGGRDHRGLGQQRLRPV